MPELLVGVVGAMPVSWSPAGVHRLYQRSEVEGAHVGRDSSYDLVKALAG